MLIETMRERGLKEGLVGRVEEIFRETKSRVRVGEKNSGRRGGSDRGAR